MTFSHYAGVAIVPTLSRIVLCAVFITAGFMKFKDADFTAEQAATLRTLGVSVSPKATPATPATSPTARRNHSGEVEFKLASFQQATDDVPATEPDSDSPPASPEITPQTPSEVSATAPSSSDPTTPAPSETAATAPNSAAAAGGETFTASAMHHITLMLHAKGWPRPVLQAWLAAMTELVAGALLAIGLFSRLWGFALAVVMGVAFYLTSWPALSAAHYSLFALAADPNPLAMASFGLQSALFVLAFGIFLTGPGPISLDRLLFGGRTEVVEVAEIKTERH
jgi:uncharacterized membrane protein YphA (DoxX/SURF4 family)